MMISSDTSVKRMYPNKVCAYYLCCTHVMLTSCVHNIALAQHTIEYIMHAFMCIYTDML